MEIDNEFVKEIVYGIITYQKDIDLLANKHLNGWTITRLGNTDQAILRIAIYELIYTKTPSIVCINEAIELAKKYSDEHIKYKPKIFKPSPSKINKETKILFLDSFSKLATLVFK